MRKFKKAVTDSDTERCVRYDLANKPGVSNLMSIYSACTGKTFDEIEARIRRQGLRRVQARRRRGSRRDAAPHPRGERAPAQGQGLP